MTYEAIWNLVQDIRRSPRHEHDDGSRILTAYDDVEELVGLYRREVAQADHRLIVGDNEDTIRSYFAASRTSDALHRSLIHLGCVAIRVLIHDLMGRPPREVSVRGLLGQRVAASLGATEAWRHLYLLSVFRNKVIAHHDTARMGSTFGSSDGTRRLSALPEDWSIPDADIRRLKEIATCLDFRSIPENHFELLNFMFHAVPINLGQPQTADRMFVDGLVKRGGVNSFSVDEIEAMVLAVVRDADVLRNGVPMGSTADVPRPLRLR